MKKVLVINGPNLNMLGVREPEIYGKMTLEDINSLILKKAEELNIQVKFYQSNIEGEIVNSIHSAYNNFDGIIINPGAYSHYSGAIYDALKAVGLPCAEVHISNVFAREEHRHNMVTAGASKGVISGFGAKSYILALEGLFDE
ncbi:MAG: type II 3-dehydroquinate dehydratase [Ruminococcaceae bacterium]|nr:type II 3-dehydroquinate dehydratase [Oscillospiraceae bacterium]